MHSHARDRKAPCSCTGGYTQTSLFPLLELGFFAPHSTGCGLFCGATIAGPSCSPELCVYLWLWLCYRTGSTRERWYIGSSENCMYHSKGNPSPTLGHDHDIDFYFIVDASLSRYCMSTILYFSNSSRHRYGHTVCKWDKYCVLQMESALQVKMVLWAREKVFLSLQNALLYQEDLATMNKRVHLQ